MIIETHEPKPLTMRLVNRTDVTGRAFCTIVVETPPDNKFAWRPYQSKGACRAAARKLAAKPFTVCGTIAQQLGGATIIDELGD